MPWWDSVGSCSAGRVGWRFAAQRALSRGRILDPQSGDGKRQADHCGGDQVRNFAEDGKDRVLDPIIREKRKRVAVLPAQGEALARLRREDVGGGGVVDVGAFE